MSISDTDVVDGIAVDTNAGQVVLLISDHLPWDDGAHTRLLEQKLGSYIHFIRSGQITEQYPDAIGRAVKIELICQYIPPSFAEEFLLAAKRQLNADEGVEFEYKTLPEADD